MKRIAALLAITYVTLNHAAWADVTISPRVSYYFDNANQRTSALTSATVIPPEALADLNNQLRAVFGPNSSVGYTATSSGGQTNQLAVPMLGLSATVGSDDLSFTFTGMYGRASTKISVTSTFVQKTVLAGNSATDVIAGIGSGRSNAKRYDFEATAQKRLNERFAIIAGLRYERVDVTADVINTSTASNNATNLAALLNGGNIDFDIASSNSRSQFKLRGEVYSARAGVSGFIPFSESGTAFLTGMVHVSYEASGTSTQIATDPVTGAVTRTKFPQPSETSLGPDIAVGAQFSLAKNIAFDIRYRAAIYFPVSGLRSFKDPRVNHGVNMGASFRF